MDGWIDGLQSFVSNKHCASFLPVFVKIHVRVFGNKTEWGRSRKWHFILENYWNAYICHKYFLQKSKAI